MGFCHYDTVIGGRANAASGWTLRREGGPASAWAFGANRGAKVYIQTGFSPRLLQLSSF